MRAYRPGLDYSSTGLVCYLQRRTAGRGPAVAPLAHGVDDGPQIAALFGEMIGGAGWIILVRHPGQDAVLDQAVQTLGEDIARDAEACLELIEAADSQERVAHDQQTPPLTDHLEALGHRAVHSLKAGSLHGSSIKISGLHKQTHGGHVTGLAGGRSLRDRAVRSSERGRRRWRGARWCADRRQAGAGPGHAPARAGPVGDQAGAGRTRVTAKRAYAACQVPPPPRRTPPVEAVERVGGWRHERRPGAYRRTLPG